MEKAIETMEKEEYEMAFLLNPTKIEEVRDIANIGERMPQKATYFYPKMITGIIMYSIAQ
jgi:uncharacterized protein (DUF1015 family)